MQQQQLRNKKSSPSRDRFLSPKDPQHRQHVSQPSYPNAREGAFLTSALNKLEHKKFEEQASAHYYKSKLIASFGNKSMTHEEFTVNLAWGPFFKKLSLVLLDSFIKGMAMGSGMYIIDKLVFTGRLKF